MAENSKLGFTALVLAGDRRRDDPLLAHAGTTSKAVIDINGKAMVLRVLDALQQASSIQRIIMSGPDKQYLSGHDEICARIAADNPIWRAPESSPSASAYAVLSGEAPNQPVMITTADHPLLRADIVDEFCRRSIATGADVVVGLAPYDLVSGAFPELKKTVLRFSDGNYCGCNLFAFVSEAGRKVADTWREVEAERKNPRKVISLIGMTAVVRYRLGLLSLDGALAGLSKRLDVQLAAVVLPYAEAAVDVDSIADFGVLEERLRGEDIS